MEVLPLKMIATLVSGKLKPGKIILFLIELNRVEINANRTSRTYMANFRVLINSGNHADQYVIFDRS